MFSFLDRFKKEKIKKVDQELMDLDAAWELEKVKLRSVATSDLYTLFKELFEVRIEILRDSLEETPPLNDEESKKGLMIRGEIKGMRGFIKDVEDMRASLELEGLEPPVVL